MSLEQALTKLGKHRTRVTWAGAHEASLVFGWQILLRFGNGYGLSIIGGEGSMNASRWSPIAGAECEIAVLRYVEGGDFIDYRTPLTGDVWRGDLDQARVLAGQVRSWRRGQWDHRSGR